MQVLFWALGRMEKAFNSGRDFAAPVVEADSEEDEGLHPMYVTLNLH